MAEALPASLRLGAERFLSGDKPAVKPINERAVSVAWLKGFRDRVVAAADIGPDATTRDVVDKMVKTRTRDAKIAFYQLQDERELQSSMGRARYFISHAWDAKFSDVVDAAADAVTMLEPEADLRSVHVWVDIFAITQHRVANQDADLSHLGVCVRASEKGTILCLDTSGMALTRAWCLYEVWLTLLEGGDGSKQQQQHLGGLTSAPSTADAASAAALAAELRVAEDASSSSASASRLHVALQGVDVTLAGIRRMLDSLDVTTAGAFHKEDRWTILEKVARTTGFRRLNALIKQAVINSTVRTVEALCK